MKKYLYLFFVALFATMSVSLTSCSSNDNEEDQPDPNLWQGELGAATYEADAVAYEITGSSEFRGIELTESGNYIILPTHSAYYAAKTISSSMFRTVSKESRANHNGNVFGTYTKNADGTYNLKDFGTLGAYSNGKLDLTLTNGTQHLLNATKKPKVESNALNNRLCRTWIVTKAVENELDMSGNIITTNTLTGSDLQAEYVHYIVVTKAGTFLRADWNDTFVGDGSWNWVNTNQQKLYYVFNNDPDYNGIVQVSFNGDKAVFNEVYTDYDEDYGQYQMQSILTCRAM